MKQKLAMITAAITAMALVAGCSSEADSTSTSASPAAQSGTSALSGKLLF
ncbi:hypothetical protein [Paenibacillus hexagrammi]|uniref:Uncharacterized protein n=1 Tax=Paenibacillus hexagrammi TaxID=2908839 RepID=A0ABY3SEA4_9BACL|nr:hypothetical protein [Paenibacillus sp. YPD9-1]UJF31760.1 hypothetical protein L0M14_18520 [Paenibacillus sp. YPD9-1]